MARSPEDERDCATCGEPCWGKRCGPCQEDYEGGLADVKYDEKRDREMEDK